MAYTLPELGYAYDALEPHFDAKTMEIHHSKHHQAYINNANAALEAHPELLEKCPGALIKDLSQVPAEKRIAVRNNVGGHVNHTLFWKGLKTGTTLQGALKKRLSVISVQLKLSNQNLKKQRLLVLVQAGRG